MQGWHGRTFRVRGRGGRGEVMLGAALLLGNGKSGKPLRHAVEWRGAKVVDRDRASAVRSRTSNGA